MIESVAGNSLGGIDRIINTYNFASELISSVRTHTALSTTTTIANTYQYDHMGRSLAVKEKINNQDDIWLNRMEYNGIGQLKQKHLHSTNGSFFLQNTKYAYNERGWLKNSASNEFSFKLGYDTLSTPQYNGNIANQDWGTASSFPNSFSYGYDKLNRLTSSASTGIVMSEAIGYDKMGNISSLNRDGLGASTYSYNGNKLSSISGSSISSSTYSYDANGNAITDGRTGVSLNYNYLNLPTTASNSGLSLSYTFDAEGTKLKKQSTVSPSSAVTTDYVNGIQYSNGTIDFIQTQEGIARNNGGVYSYEYNLTDHLGNVRLSFNQHPVSGALQVLQKDDYYAFGLRKLAQAGPNQYLYNGKELQEELGQYDYGARFYDPVIGRWSVPDPLSEKMMSWSPYTYAFNNPIRFIDIGGMIPYPITIRSFAPFNSFGRGFHGDGAYRGYTTNSNATARVHQRINFDTDKTSITTKAWSSPTSHALMPFSLTETPSVKFTGGLSISSDGDAKTFGFGTHSAGANPMIPGSSPIDVFSDFSITENKKAGILSISGSLTGDNFPSTEAFITDPSGKSAFIGIGFYEGSPFSSLKGENKRDITSFKFDITTDKKGNFTGIKAGDKTYKLDEWNKMFENQNPHKNEQK